MTSADLTDALNTARTDCDGARAALRRGDTAEIDTWLAQLSEALSDAARRLREAG